MDKRERLHAAINRQKPDRVPIALWRHFPRADVRAEGLAEHVIAFQKEFDFDFVKVTPAAGYPAEMYGARLVDAGNREGTRNYLARPVNDWREWDRIHALDSSNPVFERERAAIRLIRAGAGDEVPILQTLFSPLTCAKNLRGEGLVDDLRNHPEALHRALESITLTMMRFALDCAAEGADAMFFATQLASSHWITQAEYREFGERYDRLVLDAIRGHADFVLLHAHGEDIYFDLLAQYPVQMINWHDRKTPPTLAEAGTKFAGARVGGFEEWGILAGGTPEQCQAQAREAIAQTDGIGLVLGPGCVLPTDTPVENIRAARQAVG